MSSNSTLFQSPYLLTSRKFPTHSTSELESVLSKSYIDTANNVNASTLGIHEIIQLDTRNKYFNTDNPQRQRQSYRKVFPFGAIAAGATLPINHLIEGLVELAQAYGTCTTVIPDFRPIPYASATVATNQIELRVTSTQIIIVNGATAPNIESGFIVLEYLLN